MIAAFFDVDGTLYQNNMWRGLMKYAAQHGRKHRARFYFVMLLPLYYLRKLHLISEDTFRKPWMANLGWMLAGWTKEQGDAAFRWVVEEYIQPHPRADVIERLRAHQAQQHAVILVSGMLAATLQLLGDALGATGVVGTQIEMRDGIFTGKTIPPVVNGADKARLTQKFLREQGLEIDFAASYSYGDSIADLSMMQLVGHPVAVYPDAPLEKLARAQGWEIIGDGAGVKER
ncbi:MAG: HAD-IB family hydrolase [Chloroflexi bacterium]|nr:HAD-IB family hydrolase [Chloroflexota bacterium]